MVNRAFREWSEATPLALCFNARAVAVTAGQTVVLNW